MDDMDRASDLEQRMLEAALRVRKPEPKACGYCHNCGEAVQSGAFCDEDCRDDWQKRVRRIERG